MTSAASPGRGGTADGRRTGWFGLTGLGLLLLGAALIPLPLDVVATGDLIEVGPALSITVAPGIGVGPVPPGVQGAYLTLRRTRATPATLLLGGLSPTRRIAAPDPRERADGHTVLGAAALAGLGIAPVRIGPDAMPVAVVLDGSAGVGRRSLAAALHVFDVVSEVDLARGRRIVALGEVGADDSLRCSAGWERALGSATAERADVIVLPRDCGPAPSAAGGGRVIAADGFTELLALLGSG